jgi:type VI secretion system protein ImpK
VDVAAESVLSLPLSSLFDLDPEPEAQARNDHADAISLLALRTRHLRIAMREEIANLVYPVFQQGLQLRDRLEQGEALDLEADQARLRALLLSEGESRKWIDYGGEKPGTTADVEAHASTTRFLGIRYALVCWLDEMFVLSSPASDQWNEQKLEGELYGTNDRAWKFWEQAEAALLRPTTDALEAFFLCVQLGFRGEFRDEPDKLQAWVSSTKSRVAKIRNQEWPYPLEYEPPTYVPPHFGRDQLQRMVFTGGVVLLLLIPIVAFLMVHRLGQ